MNSEIKIIYEFYYVVGGWDFTSYYKLMVNRETKKMLYGDVFAESGDKLGRFAINKNNLNCVHEFYSASKGTAYRVQVDDCDYTNACKKAKNIIYNHLMAIAERFFKIYEENENEMAFI